MGSTSTAQAVITSIVRYPIKGLNGQTLSRVRLETGRCIAFDRAYAIENGAHLFDPAAPRFLPKNKFLMLMSHERLAALHAEFDEETRTLRILRDGRQVSRGVLDDRIGRQLLEQFFAAYMSAELRGAPRIVHAAGHSFCDAPEQYVSLVNLASVRDLERVMGAPVDPRRFRANLYVEGLEPWVELRWEARTVNVTAGALFTCEQAIDRCAATNVDPETGDRDMAIPRALMAGFGHNNMGVYLRVIAIGEIFAGDTVSVAAA